MESKKNTTIEISKEDYYSNMYDIENLTSLNRDRSKSPNPENVKEIVDMIKTNKCISAFQLLDQLITQNPKNIEPYILRGALEIKNLVLEGEDLSPKESALRELQDYLKLSRSDIEDKMLVEVPVAKEWERINPNPQIESDVTNFYIQTDAYIYELMAANHIVQTLYSFCVLKEKVKSLNVNKMIDYGAGAGTLCILFKKLGYDIVYADLPGKLFDFAKYRFKRRGLDIPMINLQEEGIEHSDKDCIISTEVIEHVTDPKKLLSIFEKNLRQGQFLIVSESCEYVEDFASHLESNRKYGGDNFIGLMKDFGFSQILAKPFIPQMIFKKTS